MWFGEPQPFHLPEWARRDNKVTKGDRVAYDPSMIFRDG